MVKNKILIADDEADISLILKLQLEDAGYSTVRVKDGVEALEALARESFELLLLDIKMPRMDGLQVLKQDCHDDSPWERGYCSCCDERWCIGLHSKAVFE